MKMHEILTMAMRELLRLKETEKERLKENPDSEISKILINRYKSQERELHQLILNEEGNN